jgi:excisionase family DNA binding protein
MNLDNARQRVNDPEQPLNGVEKGGTLDRLLAHVCALRDEVERLRNELDEPGPKLLSIEDAAACLSLSERTIRSFVSDGTIRSLKVGRRRLIPRSALAEFVETRVEAREGGGDE